MEGCSFPAYGGHAARRSHAVAGLPPVPVRLAAGGLSQRADHREREMERASHARVALRPDAPVMALDDLAADIQPKSESNSRAYLHFDPRHLIEALENVAQLVCGDAGSAIMHRDDGLSSRAVRRYRDRRIFRRV